MELKFKRKISFILILLMIISIFAQFNIVKAEEIEGGEGEPPSYNGNLEEDEDTEKSFVISAGDGIFEESRKLGDANFDGIVTYRDGYITLENYAGNNDVNKINMDVNLDGAHDVEDSLRILQNVSGNENMKIMRMNEYTIGTVLNLKMVYTRSKYKEELIKSDVTWTSSDENVATINSTTGKLEFVGVGTTTVTATTADNKTDSVVLYCIEEKAEKEALGVKISKDNFKREVLLTVDCTNKVAFKAEFFMNSIRNNNVDFHLKVVSPSNWSITESNYSEGRLKLIAEMNDGALTNENLSDKEVVISMTLPEKLENSPFDFTEVVLNTNAFEQTDRNNNVINPLAEYNAFTSGNLGVVLSETLPYRVKAECKENVTMTEDTMYVKLNGTNNGTENNSLIKDLEDCLEYRWNISALYFEGEEYNTEVNSPYDEELGKLHHVEIALLNNNVIKYNVVQIGDVCKDTNYAIDINDVVYLRKAIVGLYKEGYPEDFEIRATDTNGSNISTDDTRNLGDIGDVIAIRQRILNKKWSDLK